VQGCFLAYGGAGHCGAGGVSIAASFALPQSPSHKAKQMFANFRRGSGLRSIKRRDDRRRMRSENDDWSCELGADSHEFNKQVQHLGKGRWLWYPKWLWDKNTAI